MTESEHTLTSWQSTYHLITVQRLLGHFNISLPDDALHIISNTQNTFYHQLLALPLKNIFNGVILGQVQDYLIYAQKILIDYFMSGESSRHEAEPGASVREDLEAQHNFLAKQDDTLQQIMTKHKQLIAQSQATLIAISQDWQQALDIVATQLAQNLSSTEDIFTTDLSQQFCQNLLIRHSLTELNNSEALAWQAIEHNNQRHFTSSQRQVILDTLEPLLAVQQTMSKKIDLYQDEILMIQTQLQQLQQIIKQAIVDLVKLIDLLPNYQINEKQLEMNQAAIDFDIITSESNN